MIIQSITTPSYISPTKQSLPTGRQASGKPATSLCILMSRLMSYFMEKGISLEYYKHLVTACLYFVYVNRSTELTPKSVAKENYDYRKSYCKSYPYPDRGLVYGKGFCQIRLACRIRRIVGRTYSGPSFVGHCYRIRAY